jgi:hypothetical protein
MLSPQSLCESLEAGLLKLRVEELKRKRLALRGQSVLYSQLPESGYLQASQSKAKKKNGLRAPCYVKSRR